MRTLQSLLVALVLIWMQACSSGSGGGAQDNGKVVSGSLAYSGALTYRLAATLTPHLAVNAVSGTKLFTITGVLPHGLTFNTSTGEITGTPTRMESTSHTVSLSVSGYTGEIVTPLQLTVTENTAALTYTIGYGGAALIAQSAVLLSPAFAGNPPEGDQVFSLSGTLPAGLSFNSQTGEITGAPITLGSTNITITHKITGYAQVTSVSFQITVSNPILSGVITYPNVSFTRGTASSLAPTVSGLPGGVQFTSTALPAGMALNSSTGMISGTPTTNGAFQFTVTAQHSNFAGVLSVQITGSVVDPSASGTIMMSYPTTANLSRGTANAVTPSVSGIPAGASASYTLQSGALPGGMALNTSTGVISGIPSVNGATVPALFPVTVKLTVSGFVGAVLSSSNIQVVNAPYFYEWSRVSSGIGLAPGVDNNGMPAAFAGHARMAALGGDLYLVLPKLNHAGNPYGVQIWKSSNKGLSWYLYNEDTSIKFTEFELIAHANTLVLIGGNYTVSPGVMVYSTTPYTFTLGSTQWGQQATAAYSEVIGHRVVKQGNVFYLLGGAKISGLNNSIYISTDGIQWTALAMASPFSARTLHCAISDGTSLYVYGGLSTSNSHLTDVWRSADSGLNWAQVASNVHVGGSIRPTCGAVNGALFIAQGTTAVSANPLTFGSPIASVHGSNDGTTWTIKPNVADSFSTQIPTYNAANAVLSGVLYSTFGATGGAVNDQSLWQAY